MQRKTFSWLPLALIFLGARTGPVAPPFRVTEKRARCAEFNLQRNPYFGDLHVHTTLSLDASTQGTRNRPRDAYRLARGKPLGIQPYDESGSALRSVQLERPLDFAAVTDHAELLGEREICGNPELEGYDSWVCRLYRYWPRAAFFVMNKQAMGSEEPSRFGFCGPQGKHCLDAARTAWQEIQAAAEEAYDRTSACRFTTFVGYEWTGAPASFNLHRNVLFRNRRTTTLPISYVETPRAELLWDRLNQECVNAHEGCEAIVIPHNSNLSGGLMFRTTDPNGHPLTQAQAQKRVALERLVEIMQHKGASECRPGFGTNDELCAFEQLRTGNFAGRYLSWLDKPQHPMNYVRNVLREGLQQEDRLGVNPFKFGLIGSTDTHMGTPGAVREDAGFPGHGGAGIPARDAIPPGLPEALDFNPGGLVGLWAEENSRDSLFSAMMRREAFATSGPRIVVRFFGGWALPDNLCQQPAWVRIAYAVAHPMGSDLAPPGPALRDIRPSFIVSALADPGTGNRPGTPLQRIQIIKGWQDGKQTHERVYDIAGDTHSEAKVDPATCATSGPGFHDLCSVWLDPDFDPNARAFYYARVLENPTCRWSQQICIQKDVDCKDPKTIGEGLEPCCAPDHRPVIQERAWSSPIWYSP